MYGNTVKTCLDAKTRSHLGSLAFCNLRACKVRSGPSLLFSFLTTCPAGHLSHAVLQDAVQPAPLGRQARGQLISGTLAQSLFLGWVLACAVWPVSQYFFSLKTLYELTSTFSPDPLIDFHTSAFAYSILCLWDSFPPYLVLFASPASFKAQSVPPLPESLS